MLDCMCVCVPFFSAFQIHTQIYKSIFPEKKGDIYFCFINNVMRNLRLVILAFSAETELKGIQLHQTEGLEIGWGQCLRLEDQCPSSISMLYPSTVHVPFSPAWIGWCLHREGDLPYSFSKSNASDTHRHTRMSLKEHWPRLAPVTVDTDC